MAPLAESERVVESSAGDDDGPALRAVT
jgi:hypothetical protein